MFQDLMFHFIKEDNMSIKDKEFLEGKESFIIKVSNGNSKKNVHVTEFKDKRGFFSYEYEGENEYPSLSEAAIEFENSSKDIRNLVKAEREKKANKFSSLISE